MIKRDGVTVTPLLDVTDWTKLNSYQSLDPRGLDSQFISGLKLSKSVKLMEGYGGSRHSDTIGDGYRDFWAEPEKGSFWGDISTLAERL